jgi:hypothetical protein
MQEGKHNFFDFFSKKLEKNIKSRKGLTDIMTKKENNNKPSLSEILLGVFITISGTIAGLCFTLFVSWCITQVHNSITQINTTTDIAVDIISITYKEQTQGSFVLGYGHIDQEEYYVCYQKQTDNGVSLLKLPTKNTVLYPVLSQTEQPYAILTYNNINYLVSAKIYIPENTIHTEYNLSLDT